MRVLDAFYSLKKINLIWLINCNAMHFDSFSLVVVISFKIWCYFLLYEVILVIHCCFQNKDVIRITKKRDVPILKFCFDSLALKRLGLYVNLLGPYVAYPQPFNLVYK
jgi:hypothetical protein